jgi:hypothetical protein
MKQLMKRNRNFFIAAVLIFVAGFFAHFASMDYMRSFSVIAIFLGAAFFIAGVIVFAVNFRE